MARATPPSGGVEVLDVETRHGPARAHVHALLEGAGAHGPVGALVLGHGAGGGVDAPDLVTVAGAATAAGFVVVLVEQPYRVAGRRAPPRAPVLDAAWTDVVGALRAGPVAGLPLVVGGRSSGARVAARTAAATGADAALLLAFPLRPPARAGREPGPSRLPELEAAGVPVLVVQGVRDPFGVPPAAAGRAVVTLAGDHALRTDRAALADAVRDRLPGLVTPGVGTGPAETGPADTPPAGTFAP